MKLPCDGAIIFLSVEKCSDDECQIKRGYTKLDA